MSLISLLFVCVAQAAEEGALLWLDKEPDPRVHPELRPLSASSVAPNQEWGPADQAAIYQLSSPPFRRLPTGSCSSRPSRCRASRCTATFRTA